MHFNFLCTGKQFREELVKTSKNSIKLISGCKPPEIWQSGSISSCYFPFYTCRMVLSSCMWLGFQTTACHL